MAKLEIGELFEFMRTPVPKVQRPGGAHLEGVTPCNMVQVHLSTTVNEVVHRWPVAGGQGFGMGFDPLKKSSIFNQRDFNCFGNARTPVAVVEGEQKLAVVEHGHRRNEGAQEIFLTPVIHPVFHPNAGIVLREHGGRNADMPDAPVRNASRVAY